MKKATKYIVQSLFLFHILLAFLIVFESKIQVPFWVQPLGRMHPLILHFPVAFIGLLVLLTFAKKSIEISTYKTIHFQLLILTAFTTVVATLMGFLLSLEGYESNLMQLHKWLGIGLSFYIYLLVYLYNKKAYTPFLFGGFILVVLVGHYGAGLTHGSSFITEPLQTENETTGANDPIYKTHIQPLLDAKCKSCHNSEKPKGGLDVTSIEAIQKGGKHGALWIPGEPENSLFVKRVLLPLEHKKHMAPEGKPQLTKEEIELISLWIHQGANDTIQLAVLEEKDTLRQLIAKKWLQKKTQKVYEFDAASVEEIQSLEALPYISIKPLSGNSPALVAKVLGGSAYKSEYLRRLLSVKEQLISLNLSNLGVSDADLQLVKEFTNLEHLWLNFTEVTSKGLEELKTLKNLKTFSVVGTSVDDTRVIKSFKNLETLCVWDTQITQEGLEDLAKRFPEINLEKGIESAKTQSVVAPPKVIGRANVKNNGDVLYLKHLDNDVTVRYSINNKVTEDSEVYKDGIVIDFKDKNSLVVKARAYREGNKPSKEISFKVHRKGISPSSVETLYANYTADYFGDAKDLLIDDFFPQRGAQSYGWSMFTDQQPLEAVIDLTANKEQIKELILRCATYYRHSKNNLDFAKVYGSNNKENWKVIDQITYAKKEKFSNKYAVNFNLKNTSYSYYKVIIQPGLNKRFFVSQLFLYQ